MATTSCVLAVLAAFALALASYEFERRQGRQ